MKIHVIENIEDFFRVVDGCSGQVHVVSPEGDDIVLTSKLSRFVLGAIPKEELKNLNLELKCENNEDTLRFISYLAGQE